MLLGPDVLSRAAASRTNLPEEQWMLRQSKAVRASYVREVLDKGGDVELRSQIWMLGQSEKVRESYARDVLEPRLES